MNRKNGWTRRAAAISGLALALAIFAWPCCCLAQGPPLPIHVDHDGPSGNGSGWDSVYNDLQMAILNAVPEQTIRVAGGTYKPTSSSDRGASFALRSDVTILGGYAGSGAPNPNERLVTYYETILSGDINLAGPDDNSYNVVRAMSVDASAKLDGVTISSGNADHPSEADWYRGGGSGSGPQPRRCWRPVQN